MQPAVRVVLVGLVGRDIGAAGNVDSNGTTVGIQGCGSHDGRAPIAIGGHDFLQAVMRSTDVLEERALEDAGLERLWEGPLEEGAIRSVVIVDSGAGPVRVRVVPTFRIGDGFQLPGRGIRLS